MNIPREDQNENMRTMGMAGSDENGTSVLERIIIIIIIIIDSIVGPMRYYYYYYY